MEKHRLYAIMFTDIVDFTKLMEADEVKALRLLDDHRRIVGAAAAKNSGEIIKGLGDGFLVRFDSALNAVLCAFEIQHTHGEYNRKKPLSDQMQVRIGIHLGDIVIRGGDVFGDGVNVASRVQPLADPDGICMTRTVYDMVKRRLDVRPEELGARQLKNVSEAVEVFQYFPNMINRETLNRIGKQVGKPGILKRYIKFSISVSILVAFLIIVIIPVKRQIPKPKVTENRVAVLPLRNLTGDEEKDYFAEGLAEDLIFRLQRIQDISVYPLVDVLSLGPKLGSTSEMRKILGVKYLVQGSLQQIGDTLRVLLGVVDTETMDRPFSGRFYEVWDNRHLLHDKLAKAVLFSLVDRVSGPVEAALAINPSVSSYANDLYLKARHAQRQAVTWDD